MEFLPTHIPVDFARETLGIANDCEDEGEEDTCEATELLEKATTDRSEKGSIFDKLAVFIIIGLALVVMLVILVALFFLQKFCPCVQKCYAVIKQKLFYNTLIRYLLMGSLKMQITFCGALAIGTFVPVSEEKPMPDRGTLITSTVLMVLLTLIPFIFALILWRNKDQLGKPAVEKKIGAMYFGF